MSSSMSRALALPEILHAIARWVPLFESDAPIRSTFHPPIDFEDYVYVPNDFRSCTLVSRIWNVVFTPYLYHYYFDNYTEASMEPGSHAFDAFLKHNHLFRRYCSFRKASGEDLVPFKTEAPPRNLIGLFLYSTVGPAANLLLCNQGPQLRQLSWVGQWPLSGMDQIYQDALMNLPCLEELELRMWTVSNDLMYRMLRGCAKTLKTLRLETVKGFDNDIFHYRDDSRVGKSIKGTNDDHCNEGESRWILPQLKSLQLLLSWELSFSAVLLPQLCPALETIDLRVDMEEHSIPQLVSTLRKNCPNLNSIIYHEGYSMAHEYGYFPEPEIYASLFKDSFSSPGLQYASMGLSAGLNQSMTEALLFHATTLVILTLRYRSRDPFPDGFLSPTELGMERLAVLLGQCKHLKELQLFDPVCPVEYLEGLMAAPWGCQQLEQLVIEGYESSASDSRSEANILETNKRLAAERKRIRQKAWPRKLRHHEYRDDGQGWFLEPGLEVDAFHEAIADGDWKRRLFGHMHTTSGLRNVNHIKLNGTEFFSQEQFFDDMEAERYEMISEEGLVVDF
ncbi:MAG: hypothetical protein J3Q66DRAFT_330373 [Benniella sp.]|nr:MAG: hypothetical protein J3Q66DRAFT_330373 [Benniella sp.]